MSGEEDNFDMEAHLQHVKTIFEELEKEYLGVGRGIRYSQFRIILAEQMQVEFETNEEFLDICKNLDTENK
jgi:hypothetical protein